MRRIVPCRGVAVAAVALAAVAGCRFESTPLPFGGAKIVLVSGGGQTGAVGRDLPEPLIVMLLHEGAPVEGIGIAWTGTGGAIVEPAVAVTDSAGRAQVVLTLGTAVGPVEVHARTEGGGDELTVRATAAPRIDRIVPAVAKPGSTIRVEGAGFSPGTLAVTVGDLPVTPSGATADTVEFALPALTSPGALQLSVNGIAAPDAPALSPVVNRTATPIPLSDNCVLGKSNVTRSMSVDAAGYVYVASPCSGAGRVFVSTNGGLSFRSPATVAGSGVLEIAVQGGGRTGTAIAAYRTTAGTYVSATQDAGATWSTPTTIYTGAQTYLSLAAHDDTYHASSWSGGTLNLVRSADLGATWTTSAQQTISAAYGDVTVDDQNGNVVLSSDTPSINLRKSVDGGASFAGTVNLGNTVTYSDWATGGGVLYGVGASGMVAVALSNNAVTSMTGEPTTVDSQGNAIDADPAGNAWVVYENGTTVTVQRLSFGQTALDSAVTVSANGTNPGIATCGVGAAFIVLDGASGLEFAARVYP